MGCNPTQSYWMHSSKGTRPPERPGEPKRLPKAGRAWVARRPPVTPWKAGKSILSWMGGSMLLSAREKPPRFFGKGEGAGCGGLKGPFPRTVYIPAALPDHLQTRQGREPVFHKLEQIIQSSDGEDAPDCRSDTAEGQLVPAVVQQPPHLQEPGQARATHNINVREVNHDITIGCMTVVAEVIWPIKGGEGARLGEAGSGFPVTPWSRRIGHDTGGLGAQASPVLGVGREGLSADVWVGRTERLGDVCRAGRAGL
jgi:hypothetical protein